MSKEAKIIIFAIITMALNILAPILMINLYQDYTAESFIYGTPDKSVVITEYVKTNDYLYQENLSSLTFVQEDGYYVASYNFEDREFDIEKTYAIFVNDYICTPVDVLGSKVSGTHTIKFNDINNNTLDTTLMSIDFEFYTTYSSILLKVETADITYFNGFKQNPGFILTLGEIDPNLLEIVKNTTVTIEPEEPADENVVAVTFKSYDDTTLNTYYVEKGNSLSTVPDEPARAGYVFKGWSLDGTNTVDDLSTLTFEENTTLSPTAELVPNRLERVSSFDLYSGDCIWTDGINTYHSYSNQQYVWDSESSSWKEQKWTFLNDGVEVERGLSGNNIWTCGDKIYWSAGKGIQYELIVGTSTWTNKVWGGYEYIRSEYIWTCGDKIYYSYDGIKKYQYELDVETSTWIEKTWSGVTEFGGDDVRTDGTNYYLSIAGFDYYSYYKLNVETSTWNSVDSLDGIRNIEDMWEFCGDIFSSTSILDDDTGTYVDIHWEIVDEDFDASFLGRYVYILDNCVYYTRDNKTYQIIRDCWNFTFPEIKGDKFDNMTGLV